MARLGPEVCPEIQLLSDGYLMPVCQPLWPNVHMLYQMESLLESVVWCRPPVRDQNGDWLVQLRKVRGVQMPDPPPFRPTTLTHGDPTVSNVMATEDGKLVIGDALPPKDYMISAPESDMGRLIQSAAGWEVWRYGADPILYHPPSFWLRDGERRAALWCCAATIREFAHKTPEGWTWAGPVSEMCLKLMEV